MIQRNAAIERRRARLGDRHSLARPAPTLLDAVGAVGDDVKIIMDAGELVPDDIVVAMVDDHLIELTISVSAAYGSYLLADLFHELDEFLVGDLGCYERVGHFRYQPMPGGDLATREPWRMALAWLHRTLVAGGHAEIAVLRPKGLIGGVSGMGGAEFAGILSCAEELAGKIHAFTLFATHYFELTSLSDELDMVKNVHLTAIENRDNITFLYQVQNGPANQSYGLQVASLAGVPQPVIAMAKSKLRQLETELVKQHHGHQLSIFDSVPGVEMEEDNEKKDMLEDELSALDPDRMTAREALDLIYRWKEQMKD